MSEDVELEDLDTEDDTEENQAPADLVAGDTGFPDEEEIDIKVAEDAEPGDDKGEEEKHDADRDSKRKPTRLQREQHAKREARERAERAEAEVQRLASENAALQQRVAQTKDDGADDIDREIQEKTKRFREVHAQFDPDKADEEVQLLQDLAVLRVRKEDKKERAAVKERPVTEQQPTPRPHKNVQAWLDTNDWFDDPRYERETRRARAIDAQVHADGYRVEDDDYFEELERRMDAAGVRVPGRKKQGDNGAGRKESTVAGRVDAPTGGKHTVLLTPEDLATLRKLGQNVKDKKVLEEYAKNKRREEQRA